MSKQVKLIWEFRGPSAEHTAKHHVIHLKEYAVLQKIEYLDITHTLFNEFEASAFMIVAEEYMQKIRTDLKPHRGQYYTEKK